jgi:addiction module HigA family antidote
MTKLLRNPHPGDILREEFLAPLGMSQYALAKALKVPPRRINEIVHRRRAISADTDARLCRYFGLTPGFWLGLQVDYDVEELGRHGGRRIAREVRPRAA